MYPLEILQQATSQTEEIDGLKQVRKHLCPPVDGILDDDDVEQQWLSVAAGSLGNDGPLNPFPAVSPQDLLPQQADLNRFTYYLFERRFSWSEAGTCTCTGSRLNNSLHVGLLHMNSVTSEKDAQLKDELNLLLDEFLRWYLCQEITSPLLKGLLVSITEACSMPVVRKQTVIHVMEWLQLNAHHPSFHKHFIDAQSLVLCGLCDIWSAVRNACVTRLGGIAKYLSMQELESLFLELAKICLNPNSPWQRVEGALMAITTLLKCFQWIGVLSCSTGIAELSSVASNGQFYLKFGEQELSQIPEFISTSIRSIVYPLLAHPQLGVRDYATKAFSMYLSRCDCKVALESFQEAISRLSQNVGFESCKAQFPADQTAFLHSAVTQPNYKFMSACEAEGLLSICLYLIKHVHSGVLLKNWPECFSTFSLYLMHPASTVRQAASIIFKYIVAKDSNNFGLLKLVVQALCANWTINVPNDLTKSCSQRSCVSVLQKGKSSLEPTNDQKHRAIRRQFSTHQEKETSILTLHQLNKEHVESSDFCQAWEWREGRLLAYELILKFLIANHVHYLFPSYALLSSKFNGRVSADEAINRSRQSGIPEQASLSKSCSHVESGGRHIKETILHESKDTQSERPRASSSSSTDPNQPLHTASQAEAAQQILTRGGSERRKTVTDDKRGTSRPRSRTVTEGTVYKKQLSKHFSYFTNPGEGLKKSHMYASTASLLCKVRDADALHEENCETIIPCEKLLIPSPVLTQGPAHRNTFSPDIIMLQSTLSALEQTVSDSDWLQHVHLKPFSALLRHMLLQTISCHADGRWEVRRMAQQVLPFIAECIRWYDMSILTSLWNHYLCAKDSLLSYGLTLTLALSIQHVLRLMHFPDSPPVSKKGPEICQEIMSPIVMGLTQGLVKWCNVALQLMDRVCVDKLTVLAMEILIMASHPSFSTLLLERETYETSVSKKLLHVFCHAHPGHPVSQYCSSNGNFQRFSTPSDGILCCMRAGLTESPAGDVEHYMLSQLHHYLPAYLQGCSEEAVFSWLPILLHTVLHYHQDGDLTKNLIDGCLIVGSKTTKWIQQGEASQQKDLVQQNLVWTVEEMKALVLCEDLEMATLKQVFDLYTTLSGLADVIEQLSSVLSAISLRFVQSGKMDASCANNSRDEERANLAYLSNNIPDSLAENGDSSDEDDEDKTHVSSHGAESLSLSMSGGSGQAAWNAYKDLEEVRSPHGSCDNDDSDWDSWDDEQEDQASLLCVVSEFFQKLQDLHRNTFHGGQPALLWAIGQLEEKEQNFLKKLSL